MLYSTMTYVYNMLICYIMRYFYMHIEMKQRIDQWSYGFMISFSRDVPSLAHITYFRVFFEMYQSAQQRQQCFWVSDFPTFDMKVAMDLG